MLYQLRIGDVILCENKKLNQTSLKEFWKGYFSSCVVSTSCYNLYKISERRIKHGNTEW